MNSLPRPVTKATKEGCKWAPVSRLSHFLGQGCRAIVDVEDRVVRPNTRKENNEIVLTATDCRRQEDEGVGYTGQTRRTKSAHNELVGLNCL